MIFRREGHVHIARLTGLCADQPILETGDEVPEPSVRLKSLPLPPSNGTPSMLPS